MKKTILLLTALFTTLLWSCSKDVEKPGTPEKSYTLQISSATINLDAGEKGKFKITSDIAVASDLTVEVTTDDNEIIVVPSNVVITGGTTEAEAEFSALKNGEATITVSCTAENVTIETRSVKIYVGDNITPLPEVEVPETGTFIERMQGAKIHGLPAISSIRKVNNGLPASFKEGRYMIKFNQPLDHADKTSGFYEQRVIVSIAAYDKPVVFVTQGYGFGGGWNFEDNSYTEELVDILDCNQIIVEHRFFEGSAPSTIDWKHHTIENQVKDLHLINLVMREIFKGQKFISTGRSKGGQTTIYYKASFPKDIDIAVPYVAPMCYQLGDMRHAEFLKNVGSESRRQKIKALQQEMFNRREKLVPMLRAQSNPADFAVDMEVIFDLCVLEYSFMCWQYSPSSSIPDTNIGDYALFAELTNKSGSSYFSTEYDNSFFINIKHDLGYYGYDVTQFTNTVITQTQASRWIEDIVTPTYGQSIEFDPAMGQKAKTFLQSNTTDKMIFIYGEYDAWSAAAVDKAFFAGKTNMFRYDCPGMDHSTFIGSFNAATQKEIKDKIKEWLAE